MKTRMKKIGDTLVVNMDGKLDVETHQPLRENLNQLITHANTDSVPKKIIFNLENLEFVGSSGISSFVQTLREFNAHAPERPKYCHVGSEFRKIIKALDDTQLFDFFETEEGARKSFNN